MSWLSKISQIPANSLNSQELLYHGTDNFTAYNLIQNMLLKPRKETQNTSYSGSLSSIPDAVYLTYDLGKAAKHAIERSDQTKGNPVILVIEPKELGMVHIDEDFVHQLLNGNDYFSDNSWYPSPKLINEVYEIADSYTRATDYYPNLSTKNAVIKYFKNQDENQDIDNDFLQEEGIVPNEHGDYEYDESMHTAKQIASELSNEYQKEAINNFKSMAHLGQVKAKEVYIIPFKINISTDPNDEYMVYSSYMKTYSDLQRYGTKINPKQLLFDFMKKQ